MHSTLQRNGWQQRCDAQISWAGQKRLAYFHGKFPRRTIWVATGSSQDFELPAQQKAARRRSRIAEEHARLRE